jgi:hypothetical protein
VAQNTKLIDQVRPFVPAGEAFQAAVPAQAGMNPWIVNSIGANSFGVLGLLIAAMFRVKRRLIVVTDQSVLVLAADARYAPTAVLARLERSTPIGPLHGRWAKTRLEEIKLYVHRKYHPVVERTDARAPR